VTLKPSAQAVVGGDTVTVDVDVRYFTGQPYAAQPEGQVRVVIKILPERESG
jgi:hypothetical protein